MVSYGFDFPSHGQGIALSPHHYRLRWPPIEDGHKMGHRKNAAIQFQSAHRLQAKFFNVRCGLVQFSVAISLNFDRLKCI
jgi:hypothetical protein